MLGMTKDERRNQEAQDDRRLDWPQVGAEHESSA
jgi:hypothetical protein